MTTYISGSAKSIISQANNTQFVPISGCSNSLYSSKLMNAGKVSPTAINGKLFLAYEYVPISNQPIITSIFCGGSNFDNIRDTPAIQIASIDAPPLVENDPAFVNQ